MKAEMSAEEAPAKTTQICNQADGVAPVLLKVLEPPAGSLPELRSVQVAIAADLRERVQNLYGVSWLHAQAESCQHSIEFGIGAGALLPAEFLQNLVSELAKLDSTQLALPLTDCTTLGEMEIPTTAGTCFAAHTGADIIALALYPDIGFATRDALAQFEIRNPAMAAAFPLFTDRDAEVVLVGPISSQTWRYLEDKVACRVRIFADGDELHGGIVASLYNQSAPNDFLAWMGQVGDAIFLDSRQFLAGGGQPDELDFYYSDIGFADAVKHPVLRRLTEVALSADYPLILGGPSVVNGLLYALVETAWRTNPNGDRGYHIMW